MPGPTGMGPSKLSSPAPQEQTPSLPVGSAPVNINTNREPQSEDPYAFLEQAAQTVAAPIQDVAQTMGSAINSASDPYSFLDQIQQPTYADNGFIKIPKTSDLPADQIGVGEYDDFLQRARISFGAANDAERASEMAQMFGADNVKLTEKGVYFRKPGEEKFKPYDSEDWNFKTDLGADLMGDLASFAPGMMVKASALGGPLGATVGGAAAIASTMAKDYISENILGISQDPERNKLLEGALSASVGGLVGYYNPEINTVVSNGVKKGSEVIGKFFNKVKDSTAPSEIKKQAMAFVSDMQLLQRMGLSDVKDGKSLLTIPQIAPGSEEAAQMAIDTKTMFQQNAERTLKQSSMLNTIFDNVKKHIGYGKGLDEGFSEGLGKMSKELDKFESKSLGNLREKISSMDKNQRHELPEFESAFNELSSKLGIQKDVNGKISIMTPEQIINQVNPALTLDEAKTYQSVVRGITKIVEDSYFNRLNPVNRVNMNYINGRIQSLQKVVDTLYRKKADPELIGTIIKLKDSLRNDYDNIAEKVLSDAGDNITLDAFKLERQKVSDIKGALGSIGRSLTENTSLTKNQLIKMITESKDTRTIKNVKTLMEYVKPGSFNELKIDVLNGMMEKKYVQGVGDVYSFSKLNESINSKFGSNVLGEIFGDKLPAVKAFANIADRFTNTLSKGNIEESAGMLKSLYNSVATGGAARSAGMVDIYNKLFKNNRKTFEDMMSTKTMREFVDKLDDPGKSFFKKLGESFTERSMISATRQAPKLSVSELNQRQMNERQ